VPPTDFSFRQRIATKLSECDWGLEYSRGPRASIAYPPRARGLARWNTLEGIRQLAGDNAQSAVNTWLAGVRFSQNLARGGSLIFALMAKSILPPNLRALKKAALKGKTNPAQKSQVSAVVQALPEDGFDRAAAWGTESATVEEFLVELQTAATAAADYETVRGSPAPKERLRPTEQEIHAYRELMLAVQAALREPPAKAKILLNELEPQRARLTESSGTRFPIFKSRTSYESKS
jgi:hypothetical protein